MGSAEEDSVSVCQQSPRQPLQQSQPLQGLVPTANVPQHLQLQLAIVSLCVLLCSLVAHAGAPHPCRRVFLRVERQQRWEVLALNLLAASNSCHVVLYLVLERIEASYLQCPVGIMGTRKDQCILGHHCCWTVKIRKLKVSAGWMSVSSEDTCIQDLGLLFTVVRQQ